MYHNSNRSHIPISSYPRIVAAYGTQLSGCDHNYKPYLIVSSRQKHGRKCPCCFILNIRKSVLKKLFPCHQEYKGGRVYYFDHYGPVLQPFMGVTTFVMITYRVVSQIVLQHHIASASTCIQCSTVREVQLHAHKRLLKLVNIITKVMTPVKC